METMHKSDSSNLGEKKVKKTNAGKDNEEWSEETQVYEQTGRGE